MKAIIRTKEEAALRNFSSMLYKHLPIYFQNLYVRSENKKVKKERYGEIYAELLRELASKRADEFGEAVQWKEIHKLLKHSIEHSPFYRKFYKGINVEALKGLSDLPKLPVVEREAIHQNIQMMHAADDSAAAVAHEIDREGIPLKFLLTKEDIQKRNAFMDFFKQQNGADSKGLKQAIFTSRKIVPEAQEKKIYWRDNRPEKIRLYSNYYCTNGNAEVYIRNLNDFQPALIIGTAPILYKLAAFLNEAQEKLASPPQALFLQGGLMEAAQRKEIEKAFGCPVRNLFLPSYEFPVMSECEAGKFHVHPKAGIIELAEDGEMIVTNFMSYGTPIIRCRTGEYAEVKDAESPCACGSTQPVIKSRKDPDSSRLRTADNAKVDIPQLDETGHELSDGIKKIHFFQHKKEAIEVFVEAGESYTNELTETIHQNLQSAFSQDTKFNIRVVEEMPRSLKDDFQLVINKLAK